MLAHVYKSLARADTYVFLPRRDDFSALPEALHARLAPWQWVLEVTLSPTRKLARENPLTVIANLETQGFHLQFPPSLATDPLTQDWGTDA